MKNQNMNNLELFSNFYFGCSKLVLLKKIEKLIRPALRQCYVIISDPLNQWERSHKFENDALAIS